jgi:hypothetical protein
MNLDGLCLHAPCLQNFYRGQDLPCSLKHVHAEDGICECDPDRITLDNLGISIRGIFEAQCTLPPNH